jgi:hypothetical protein
VVYAVLPRTKSSPVVRDGLTLPQPSTTIALLGVAPAAAAQLALGPVGPPGVSSLHAAASAPTSSATSPP